MFKGLLKIILVLAGLFAALIGLSYLDDKNSAKYVDIYDDGEDEEETF